MLYFHFTVSSYWIQEHKNGLSSKKYMHVVESVFIKQGPSLVFSSFSSLFSRLPLPCSKRNHIGGQIVCLLDSEFLSTK